MSGDWHSESSYMVPRDYVICRILSGEKRELRHTRWMEGVNSSPWFERVTNHEVSEEKGLVLFYASGFTPVAAVKLAFHPGQQLFARESWMQVTKEKFIRYRADGSVIDFRGETPRVLSVEEAAEFPVPGGIKFMSGFRMPAQYCRLRLTLDEVSIARLHGITPAEAVSEGATLDEYRAAAAQHVERATSKGITKRDGKTIVSSRTFFFKASNYPGLDPAVARFAAMWDSLQMEPTTCWSRNPFVWVIKFSIKEALTSATSYQPS